MCAVKCHIVSQAAVAVIPRAVAVIPRLCYFGLIATAGASPNASLRFAGARDLMGTLETAQPEILVIRGPWEARRRVPQGF
jgi:hypothetical protein